MQKKELIGLSVLELKDLLVSWVEPAYRGRQVFHALYCQRQWEFGQWTPLPLALRERLERECQATLPQVGQKFQSEDGTARYLLRLADGQRIETDLMPEQRRKTICVSTQAGCASHQALPGSPVLRDGVFPEPYRNGNCRPSPAAPSGQPVIVGPAFEPGLYGDGRTAAELFECPGSDPFAG